MRADKGVDRFAAIDDKTASVAGKGLEPRAALARRRARHDLPRGGAAREEEEPPGYNTSRSVPKLVHDGAPTDARIAAYRDEGRSRCRCRVPGSRLTRPNATA